MNKIFKVVRIINKYYVVINAGAYSGISSGAYLDIYTPGTVEVLDPDTGENLGMLDYVKATVIVEDVLEKMCVCKNAETEDRKLYDFSSVVERTRTKTLELKVSNEDIQGGFAGIENNIKVGDLARKPLG